MTTATAFPVPRGLDYIDFVHDVNDRAGRKIVGADGTTVVVATSGQRLRPGKIIVIIDGALANQPATFRIVDRMEFLA